MNRTLLVLALSFLSVNVGADEYVSPHLRSNGTYVEGYHRSSPNSTTLDNYSHQGNTNPYTGAPGYRTDSGYGYSAPSLQPSQPAYDTGYGLRSLGR